MTHELESLKRYLEGEIIRVRAAEQNNFDELYSNEDEHLYATAYNVVSSLLSLNKNLKLEINSKLNHQLIKSIIENIFLLRLFRENKISGKYVDLYKLHFKVINFHYLKTKYEAKTASKALNELKDSYNKTINKFLRYYPSLCKEEAVRIFSKRYGWLYSYSYRGKETKLINVLNEYGNSYELDTYKHASIYTHSNFFISDVTYANDITKYCLNIISDSIDVSTFKTNMPFEQYTNMNVTKNEIGDLDSDKILNYTHAYKLKFKQLIEMAATKSYLETNPNRLELYILTSYLKTIKNNSNKSFYREQVDKVYNEYITNSDITVSREEFSKKVVNMLFGFTIKNKNHVEDYNTFVKKQVNKLKERKIISSTYDSIIEEINLLDHPSMYAYLSIEQGDISDYELLEEELRDYLFE